VRIVLIKTGALGDVVRTTSIALGLQRQFNASITWVTDKAAIPILNLNGISLVNCEDNAWQFGDYDWIINLEDGLKWCKIVSMFLIER
jgi:ADP-heptose:LPS heptosyltransferase